MKERLIACIHYKCENSCDLGREGTFYHQCQTCKSYKPIKGGKPAKVDNRRNIRDKLDKREMRKGVY